MPTTNIPAATIRRKRKQTTAANRILQDVRRIKFSIFASVLIINNLNATFIMNKTLYTFTAATMGAEAAQTLYDLRWMLVFIVWLLTANLWFSISGKRKSGQPFCIAQEIRSTCNKLVDYLAYLMSGAILGLAIFEPLGIAEHTATAATGLALGCIWELESIADNICKLHGIKGEHSARKILSRLLKSKFKWLSEE